MPPTEYYRENTNGIHVETKTLRKSIGIKKQGMLLQVSGLKNSFVIEWMVKFGDRRTFMYRMQTCSRFGGSG